MSHHFLVAYASKYGGTVETAEKMGEALGDFGDWEAIIAWATRVAETLKTVP